MGYNETMFEVRKTGVFAFKSMGQKKIILLAGGAKDSQARDIKTALRLSRKLLE